MISYRELKLLKYYLNGKKYDVKPTNDKDEIDHKMNKY